MKNKEEILKKPGSEHFLEEDVSIGEMTASSVEKVFNSIHGEGSLFPRISVENIFTDYEKKALKLRFAKKLDFLKR